MGGITKHSVAGLAEKMHLYATYLLFFLLPFPHDFLPLAIVLWGSTFLFWRILTPPKKARKSKHLTLGTYLFFAFVLLHFLSPLWSGDMALGLREIEGKLSLLILLVVFLFSGARISAMQHIPKVYFLGSVLSIIAFVLSLLVQYFFADVFKYQLDVLAVDTLIAGFNHPAYWSLNLVLPFFLFISSLRNTTRKAAIVLFVYYLSLGVFIFLSGSRAGLINYFVCSLIALVYYGNRYWSLGKTLISLVIVLAFSAAVFITTPKFLHITEHTEHVSVRAPRKILWSTALDMATDRPVFGYGIGVSKQRFVEACASSGIYNAKHRNLNVHNQYLEFALESGLLSLLLLLFALFYIYRGVACYNRRYVLLIYLVLGVSFAFESMLLRIAGLSTFVALLYFVLYLVEDCSDITEKRAIGKLWRIVLLLVPVLLIFLGGLKCYSARLGFDASNPLTYATKVYTVVDSEDLEGELPQEWPAEVNACRYDHTATASLWSGHAYSLNRVASKKLKQGQVLTFSTYCYVSPDFDGAWVRASIDRDGGENFGSSFYDLSQKGTWQKLEVVVDGQTGEMPAYHYFCKHNANSFEDLKGYVLFAYPLYSIAIK